MTAADLRKAGLNEQTLRKALRWLRGTCMFATLLTLAGHASAQAVLKPPVNAKPGTGKTAHVNMTAGRAAPGASGLAVKMPTRSRSRSP